jgi:hypothetical protein
MQEVDHDLAVPEDYLEAQKAAVEAVQIGRATVEAVARQGEQLQHADEMADDVQFKLDKSARLLRGMTWSGWIANMFSKEVQGPPASSREQKQVLYEHVPVVAQPAAQAIQNYQANLRIFQGCETMEQKETCQLVCDRMYEVASKEVSKLMHARDDSVQLLKHQFKKDLAYLRQRQITAQDKVILGKSPVPVASRSTTSNKSTTTTNNKNSKLEAPHQMHEQHLEVLSQNLGELNTMAHSLSEMMGQQNRRMESIDDKSEAIHETTKMVTRRAERLIQKKVRVNVVDITCISSLLAHPISLIFLYYISLGNLQKRSFMPMSRFDTCLLETMLRQSRDVWSWLIPSRMRPASLPCINDPMVSLVCATMLPTSGWDSRFWDPWVVRHLRLGIVKSGR